MPAPAVGTALAVAYPDYVRTEYKLLGALRINSPNVPIRDVAASLGYSYITVRAWLRDPAYQRYENWLIDQYKPEERPVEIRGHRFNNAREMFQEFQVEMAERLYDIIETTGNERLRAGLVQDWLDRAGVSSKPGDSKVGPTFVLTEEAMKVLMQRAIEAGVGAPVVEGEVRA